MQPNLGLQRLARHGLVGRIGEGPYKGLYSAVSAIGLVLIVWGFARYRDTAYVQIWAPPAWLHPVVLPMLCCTCWQWLVRLAFPSPSTILMQSASAPRYWLTSSQVVGM